MLNKPHQNHLYIRLPITAVADYHLRTVHLIYLWTDETAPAEVFLQAHRLSPFNFHPITASYFSSFTFSAM
jgi:hypothetical protein